MSQACVRYDVVRKVFLHAPTPGSGTAVDELGVECTVNGEDVVTAHSWPQVSE